MTAVVDESCKFCSFKVKHLLKSVYVEDLVMVVSWSMLLSNHAGCKSWLYEQHHWVI